MLVVGLTGGIGTGKTKVSSILKELGAEIVNADLLGHEAYRPHTEAWQEVVTSFGKDVLTPDGEVDRKKLGAIVFNDAEALRRLNAIMHPRIRRMVEERIERLKEEGHDAVVVEAALLVEAGWETLVDEVWMTTSPEDTVVQRLRSRDNMDERAIRARALSQMPQAERVKHSDVVIDNGGSLLQLRDQVIRLWKSRDHRAER